jgi:MurNAc alpha-1-phosphate uridylyltransferase
MRAMILAAGRGERLRPLTDSVPKPLVKVGGRTLIDYHLSNLATAGFREIVINLSHLGQLVRDAIGDGSRWHVNIHYSDEPPGALETGGGIQQALPMLGESPFLVINGDIWTDYSLGRLRAVKCDQAHLIMVPNPDHNPGGDFRLDGARLDNGEDHRLTFSGIAVYHPRFFATCKPGRFSVAPMLHRTMDEKLVTGELHRGAWYDTGTPERLAALQTWFMSGKD